MQRDARSPKRRFLAVAACALASCLVLTACSSTPNSRFYVLTPTETSASGEASSIKVGIEPVILPAAVDRPQMVMNVSPNERSLWEFDRWAGPLAENMGRVLALNLEAHLGANSAYTLPSRHAPPVDYMVTVEVLQLDAYPEDGKLSMLARFDVADRDGKWITSGRVRMDEDHGLGPTKGAEGIASAISAGAGLISEAIAQTLQAMPAQAAASGAGSSSGG